MHLSGYTQKTPISENAYLKKRPSQKMPISENAYLRKSLIHILPPCQHSDIKPIIAKFHIFFPKTNLSILLVPKLFKALSLISRLKKFGFLIDKFNLVG